MVALRAFERPHVMTGLIVGFDAGEPHLGPALRAVGTFRQLLKGLMVLKLAHDLLLRSMINFRHQFCSSNFSLSASNDILAHYSLCPLPDTRQRLLPDRQ